VKVPDGSGIDESTHPLAYAYSSDSNEFIPLTRYVGGDTGNTAFKFNIIKAETKENLAIRKAYKNLGFLNLRWKDESADFSNPIDDLKGADGLLINADNTEVASITWNLKLSLKCDAEATEVKDLDLEVNESQKLFHITLAHKDACGYDVINFLDGLGWFQYVVEITLICAGLFICLLGLKMWKPSIAIIGFLAGACASFVFINLIWTSFDNGWKIWLMLGIS